MTDLRFTDATVENQTNHRFMSPMLVVGGAIAAAATVIYLMNQVVKWGHYVHQQNMSGDYLWGLTWAVILGLSLCIWVDDGDLPAMVILWCVRVVVTLLLMLPVENHYLLDGMGYFASTQGPLHVYAHQYTGTARFKWIIDAHAAMLPASYHLFKVSFAMMGLIAVYIFYRAAVLFTSIDDRRLLYILGLVPGVTFWSSMVTKDPVVMLGVAIYSYGVVGWLKNRRLVYLLWVLIGMAIATIIRVWMGPIMLAPLGLTICLLPRSMTLRTVLALLTLLTMLVAARPLMRMLAAKTAADLVQEVVKHGNSFEAGGSATHEMVNVNSSGSIIRFAPWGAFSALFRPLPGEVRNPFGVLAGLEDLVILWFALRAAMRFRLRALRNPVVLWATALVVLWALFYGFISTHNMGTAVRYRVQIMPVVIMLILYYGQLRESRDLPLGSAARTENPT